MQGSFQLCDANWIHKKKEQLGLLIEKFDARYEEVGPMWKVHVLKGENGKRSGRVSLSMEYNGYL